jgi:hypothetical protein
MIRVELDGTYRLQKEHAPLYRWSAKIPAAGTRGEVVLSGESIQPLLDACREILPILGESTREAALFWPGKEEWAAKCSLGWGAAHIAYEDKTTSPVFRPYREFPKEAFR